MKILEYIFFAYAGICTSIITVFGFMLLIGKATAEWNIKF